MSTDMIKCVTVNGWEVGISGMGDNLERVRDIEAGTHFGYARPRNIRKLIYLMLERGELTDVYMRSVTERMSIGNGAVREQVVKEYWLTEGQLIQLAGHGRTDRAKEIKDKALAAFAQAREEKRSGIITERQAGQPMMSETQAKAEFLKALRPFHEDAMLQLEELQAAGKITPATAMAHRTALLQRAGIDLTKLPEMSYENLPTTAEELKGPTLTLPAKNLEGVPGRPIKAIQIKPISNLDGFFSATRLAEALGIPEVNDRTVGAMARVLGIFGKQAEVENEWGCFSSLEGNGSEVAKHWKYSEKAKALLTTALQKYADARRLASRRTRNAEVMAQVAQTFQ